MKRVPINLQEVEAKTVILENLVIEMQNKNKQD